MRHDAVTYPASAGAIAINRSRTRERGVSMKISRRNSLKALTAAVALPLTAQVQPHGIRFIILDVGGTLLEDRGDVVGSLRSALGRRGIVVSAADIGPWRGAS